MPNKNLMPISEGSSYNVYVPQVEFFTDKILNNYFFSYTKLSVEWWMLLSKATKAIGLNIKNGIDKKLIPRIASEMILEWNLRQKMNRKYKANKSVIRRILEMSIDKKPSKFFLGVTDRSIVRDTTFPLPNRAGELLNLIKGTLPKGEIPIHALPFRIWAVTGEINRFFDLIRHKNIVVVGPSHLQNLGYKLKLKHYNYVNIHNSNAILHVEKTKLQIEKLHDKFLSGHDDVTYFFIGGSAAMWLITELHGKLKNANLIDIGRAFDVYYYYDPVMKQYPNWMFGQWLNGCNTAWIRNNLIKDSSGVYCVKK